MINLGDAVLFFKGDLNDLDKALGDAKQAANDSLGNIKQLAFEAGAAMTAMGGAILGGLGVAVTQFANAGDEVNDMSKKIGFSTEEVSRWKFALGQSGGDVSMLQTAVRGMANSIDAARTSTEKCAEAYDQKLGEALSKADPKFAKLGNEVSQANAELQKIIATADAEISRMERQGASQQELTDYRRMANRAIKDQETYIDSLSGKYNAFAESVDINIDKIAQETENTDAAALAYDRLGINIQTLEKMSPEQKFMEIALAVAALPDPMDRATIAQDIFGKSGMDLLPVLAEGREGLKKMFDQAERAGAVFSQQEADLADAYNDAIGELGAAASGAGKEIAIALIPTLIDLMGWVRDTVIGIKDWAQANPALFESLVQVTAVLGAVMAVLGPILMILPGIATAASMLGPAFAAIGGVFAALAGAISLPVVAIVAAVAAIGFAAYEVWENWDDLPGMFENMWTEIKGYTEEGVGYLGEAAGWISGNFVQMFTDPVTFIQEYWQGLADFFDWLWVKIGTAVDAVMTNVLEPAWTWMKEMYDWLSETFWGAFGDSFNAAANSGDTAPPPPAFASGTLSAPGGLAWVGEEGPELVNLPRGAQVIPAAQSAAMAGGATITINMGGVTLPNRAMVDEFNRSLGDEISRRLSMRGLQPRLA